MTVDLDNCRKLMRRRDFEACRHGPRKATLWDLADKVPGLVADVERLRGELERAAHGADCHAAAAAAALAAVDAFRQERDEARAEVERYGHLRANPCRRCGCMHDDAEQPPQQVGPCGGGGEIGSRWVCPSCAEVERLTSLLRLGAEPCASGFCVLRNDHDGECEGF